MSAHLNHPGLSVELRSVALHASVMADLVNFISGHWCDFSSAV